MLLWIRSKTVLLQSRARSTIVSVQSRVASTVLRLVWKQWQRQVQKAHKTMIAEPTTETTDQILPETETEAPKPKTPRGRPKGTSTSGVSGSGKLEKELRLIEDGLNRVFGFIAVTSAPLSTVSPVIANDAVIVGTNGALYLTPAIVNLARHNPRLRAGLLAATETNAYMELAFAFCAIAIPIAANHGIIPSNLAAPFMPFAQQEHNNASTNGRKG